MSSITIVNPEPSDESSNASELKNQLEEALQQLAILRDEFRALQTQVSTPQPSSELTAVTTQLQSLQQEQSQLLSQISTLRAELEAAMTEVEEVAEEVIPSTEASVVDIPAPAPASDVKPEGMVKRLFRRVILG